jgi:hypothetical protein
MKYLSLLIGAICFATIVNPPIIARADNLSPSAIVSNAQSYNGKSVQVQGTVQDFSTRKTPRGTISTYKVCDQQCVAVVDSDGGTQTNGDSVTVSGTFHASLQARRQTYTNVILIQP